MNRREHVTKKAVTTPGAWAIPPGDLQRNLSAVEEAINQVTTCKLVVIDPISAYLGKVDSRSNADVWALLHALGELAERHSLVVVAVTHLTKGAGGSALYRATGSLSFVAAAWAAWLVTKDSEPPASIPWGWPLRLWRGAVRWEAESVIRRAGKRPRCNRRRLGHRWSRTIAACHRRPKRRIGQDESG